MPTPGLVALPPGRAFPAFLLPATRHVNLSNAMSNVSQEPGIENNPGSAMSPPIITNTPTTIQVRISPVNDAKYPAMRYGVA